MYNFDPSIFISIHAPPRGATVRPCANGNVLGFQFTPLREGRHKAFVDKFKPKLFQFTPLREGRHGRRRHRQKYEHFNSRPSARGDGHPPFLRSSRPISIHAPPRGATAKDMQFLQIFCSTLTNQHGLTIVPRNLSRLFW